MGHKCPNTIEDEDVERELETLELKPRVRFCWSCGRKLRGNHFAERKIPCVEVKVIMHKICAEEYDKEQSNPFY